MDLGEFVEGKRLVGGMYHLPPQGKNFDNVGVIGTSPELASEIKEYYSNGLIKNPPPFIIYEVGMNGLRQAYLNLGQGLIFLAQFGVYEMGKNEEGISTKKMLPRSSIVDLITDVNSIGDVFYSERKLTYVPLDAGESEYRLEEVKLELSVTGEIIKMLGKNKSSRHVEHSPKH